VSRSLVDAWQADTASTAELRRGYARFTRRPPAQSAIARLASGLVLGVVLGVGLAQGASMAIRPRWLGVQEKMAQVKAPAPTKAKAKAKAPTPAPPAAPVSIAPQPDLPVAVQPISTPTPASARSAAVPNIGAMRSAPPSSSSAIPYVQQQWQETAAALRANDFERAQTALREVEHSAGGSERDAARLARAQLLSSHGQTTEALVLLRHLQAHAQSAVVREQSRSLIARLESSARERAAEPAPEIE
jgi:hypothetical protein